MYRWITLNYQLQCLSSALIETFPHRKADDIRVTKTLLENMFHFWEIPGEVSIAKDICFIGHVVKESTKYYKHNTTNAKLTELTELS